MGNAILGLAAGAAGTAVINLMTYLDMFVRARPSSSVPAETATRLAQSAGMRLAADDTQTTRSRRTAAGSLLGYGAGLGLGAAYGLAERTLPDLPLPVSGALLGVVAMAATDVPATATGATDPLTWGPSGWLADLLPHLGYGIATVAVYRALRR